MTNAWLRFCFSYYTIKMVTRLWQICAGKAAERGMVEGGEYRELEISFN